MRSLEPAARGFTLIELVLVLILVGIMSVYAAPKISNLGLFADTGFRDQAVSALQMGRKYAIAQRRNVRVALSGNSLTFTIDQLNDDPNAGGTFVPLAMSSGKFASVGSACAANQVCAGSSSVALAGPALLTYSPLGLASASSYQYSVSDSSAGYAASITVDPQTGYAY